LNMNRKYHALLIILSSLILLFFCFYNKFPLVHSDTGTYISSGFSGEVPENRPLIYGLLIRHVSLSASLYLVVLFQALLLSLLLFYYFKYFTAGTNLFRSFLPYIFLITFTTGVSYHASQLLPDIFTPMCILSLGLLIMVPGLKRPDLVVISVITVVAIPVHNAHYQLYAGMLLLISLLFAFRKTRRKMYFLHWKRLAYAWGLFAAAILLASGIHAASGSSFSPTRGGHVFLMSRMNHLGILKEYLEESCGEKEYRICEYRDSLPFTFIWDYEKSPLYKTGGWEANREEYVKILRDIHTTPRYLFRIVTRDLESAFNQFFNFETGPPKIHGEKTPPHANIHWRFPEHMGDYAAARQSKGTLDVSMLNHAEILVVAISLLLMLIMMLTDIPFSWKFFLAFILAGLVLNALINGMVYVSPRYQSRVVWLLTLPLFLGLLNKEIREAILPRSSNGDI